MSRATQKDVVIASPGGAWQSRTLRLHCALFARVLSGRTGRSSPKVLWLNRDRSTKSEDLSLTLPRNDGRGILVRLLAMTMLLAFSYFSVVFAQEFRYDSHGHRDPFVAPAAKGIESKSSPKEVRLEGIVVDPTGGSVAIVNGQMLREGDTLNGLVLVKLEENRALFEREEEVFEIVLNKDDELIKQYLAEDKINQTSESVDNKSKI